MENFEIITLNKEMYESSPGKSFIQCLEELDPSGNYRGTPFEGLDAFERQLKRFDIHVSGPESDCVGKFFESHDSAVLFPEYVARAVQLGVEENDLSSRIVATKTKITGTDYRSTCIGCLNNLFTPNNPLTKNEEEEVAVRFKEHLVKLNKRGRLLSTSYEALRFVRLDLFTITLKQIGAQIARELFKDAVTTLINGDGNQSEAPEILLSKYDDSIGRLSYLYNFNTFIAAPRSDKLILELSKVRGTSSFYENLLRSDVLPAGTVIGLNKNCTLEQVQVGGISVDYDKLIDRQFERALISQTTGFSKIYSDDCCLLKLED